MKVLVAYSTRIGLRFGDGIVVRVDHADAASRPAQYDAFVIGGAMQLNHGIDDAARFVRLHYMLLADRPVWLFAAPGTANWLLSEIDRAPREQPG